MLRRLSALVVRSEDTIVVLFVIRTLRPINVHPQLTAKTVQVRAHWALMALFREDDLVEVQLDRAWRGSMSKYGKMRAETVSATNRFA